MRFTSSAMIQRIMSVALCLSLLVFLDSCSKNNDFTPELLDLASAKVPGTKPLSDRELLGKYIYFDASYSATAQYPSGGAMTQSCASCHLPQQGYAGYANATDIRGIGTWGFVPYNFKDGIGEGAVTGVFGGRKPPSSSYATFSPILELGKGEMKGEYRGGLFWDGRATGMELGNPAAEQARGPFLADKEHNFNTQTGRRDLLVVLRNSHYYPLYKKVWGAGLDAINHSSDPKSPLVTTHYNNVAFSIAAYEASSDINQFSSKFDDVMQKKATFTREEAEGYRLMRSSETKNCGSSGCHGEKQSGGPSLFTDFGYDNIGLPWKDAYRKEDGLKRGGVDQGLYTTLVAYQNPNNLKKTDPKEHIATFKTPSLRNVALGEKNKRFMHNGIFSTLEEVMHFYNTRDVKGAGWNTLTNSDTKGAGWRPWGSPEYAATMKRGDEIGNLGLSVSQEKAIVAFMRTLSDTKKVLPPPVYSATPSQVAN